MPLDLWCASADYMAAILNSLHQHPHILLEPERDAPFGAGSDHRGQEGEYIRIWGVLAKFIMYLHFHLLRGLSFNNEYSMIEYEGWLDAEHTLFLLAQSARSYLEWRGHFKDAAKVARTAVKLVYYKDERHVTSLIWPLVSLIYEHGGKRTTAQSLLCDIYHHAIMDHFSTATDLLLKIPSLPWFQRHDNCIVIPFNRAVAQVGLCAFRHGFIAEAHSFLSMLFASRKVDELLGQCYTPCSFRETTPEEEELMRKSQMPRHMHINLNSLATVYVICIMLVEVSKSTRNGNDIMSVMEKMLLEVNESGPDTDPEDFSLQIMAATAFLRKGDFKNSYKVISSLVVLILPGDQIYLLGVLEAKMKEAAAKMYLLFNDSPSMSQLNIMFGLSETQTCNIVTESSVHQEFKWTGTLSILAETNEKAISSTA